MQKTAYQQFSAAMFEAGAHIIATDKINRSEPCTLETFSMPGGALLLVQHWPKMGGFDYFRQGAEHMTELAIADALKTDAGMCPLTRAINALELAERNTSSRLHMLPVKADADERAALQSELAIYRAALEGAAR